VTRITAIAEYTRDITVSYTVGRLRFNGTALSAQISASEMTYIVSGGALNSTHSLISTMLQRAEFKKFTTLLQPWYSDTASAPFPSTTFNPIPTLTTTCVPFTWVQKISEMWQFCSAFFATAFNTQWPNLKFRYLQECSTRTYTYIGQVNVST